MKKRFMLVVLLAVMFTLIVASGNETLAKNPTTLKFAAVFAPPGSSPSADIAVYWQKLVTDRTKGEIIFKNYWGCSLGSPAEHIDLLQTGMADIVQTHQWYTPTRMPFGEFEYVFPFGVTDYVLATKAMRQIRSEFPQFAKELKDNNGILMADPSQGVLNFLAQAPLKTIEDFKGRKVTLIGRYFGRLLPPGATAVVRPAHERYDLLKHGVASVDLNALDNQYVFKLHEVTGYWIKNIEMLAPNPLPIIMNLNTFNKFSPEVQKILLESGKETELKAATEIIPQSITKIAKVWSDAGVKIVEFPDKEKQKWIDTLEDIPAEWAKEMETIGLPGFDLVRRWQEMTTAMGHKWPRKWGIKK